MSSQPESATEGRLPPPKTTKSKPKRTPRPPTPVDWSSGFLALPKAWIRNHWLGADLGKLSAFILLLLDAAHEPRRVMDGATAVDIPVGGSIWSVNRLAKRWGWSRNKTSKFLEALCDAGDITLEQPEGSQQTVITCLAYSELVEVPATKGQRKGNERAGNGQPKGNEGATKNIDNKENQGNIDTGEPPAHLTPKPGLTPQDPDRRVWLTPDECQRIATKHGQGWLSWVVSQLSHFFQNTKKWKEYKDHYRTACKWIEDKKGEGFQWVNHPTQGPGVYKQWVAERVGGANV